MKNSTLFACIILCLTKASFAQTPDIKTPSNNIEVINVAGNKQIISNNFAILKREDFINSSQTLSDLLQSINGLQIRQIGGLGNPVSVSIRGSNSKQVQLYIDGQLVNDSQFGGFDLNQIPTEHIESIEISKNQAIGTGSTPIGGVIRINTYNANTDTTNLSIAGGSFGYQEINLLTNHSYQNHSLSFGANYIASDNDYDYKVPQSFNDSSQSINEPLRNNQFKKHAFFINDNISFGAHQIRLNVQYNKQEKALPNYRNNTPENSSELSSDTLRYSYQHIWSSQIEWFDSVEFEINNEEKEEEYLAIPDGTLQQESTYNSDKKQAQLTSFLIFETQHGNLKVNPFVNIAKQTFDSLSLFQGEIRNCNGISSCDVSAKQTQTTLGSRIEWQQAQLPISSYILFSQLREKNTNIATNQINAESLKNNDTYHTQELGFVYQPKHLSAELILSKGIRTPTLFELFGDRGLFKGNDDLLPEQAKTITLGIKHNNNYQGKAVSIAASIYQQELENSIVAIFNSSGIGSYSNVNDAVLKGFEFESQIELLPSINLILQSNFIDSKTSSTFNAFNNKKLPGIYHQQYSAALQYNINSQWQINLRTHLDQDLYFNRPNIFESNNGVTGKPAKRETTDLFINWKKSKYSVSLLFNNIFDQQYQDLANRPAQGRNIQLKLSIKGI